ncbi:MAG TPA: hypothetical protein VKX39_03805 [Bryobacteraceae bacterium]|nr:hypothetical protein [Bryobacteraceae bacterium]
MIRFFDRFQADVGIIKAIRGEKVLNVFLGCRQQVRIKLAAERQLRRVDDQRRAGRIRNLSARLHVAEKARRRGAEHNRHAIRARLRIHLNIGVAAGREQAIDRFLNV